MINIFKNKRERIELEKRRIKLEEDKVDVERKKLIAQQRVLQYLSQSDNQPVEQFKYEAPKLMPGVVPNGKVAAIAMDSCASIYDFASQGTPNFFPSFVGYPQLAMMSQSSDYRSVPETTATEMVREWGKFKIIDADVSDDTLTDVQREALAEKQKKDQRQRLEKINALDLEFKRHDIRSLVKRAIEVEMTMGRAQVYIDLAGHDETLPFVMDSRSIKKESLKGFSLIEPMWSTPSVYNANDPTSKDFYVPTKWYVLGREVHADRLITMIMRPVPDILKPAYNFGGISMLQLMQPYVQRYQRTADSISELIHSFSLTILAMDMSDVLAGKNDPGVLMRASLFNRYKDNTGLMLISKEDEEISQINTPLSGLPELFKQSQEQMAAPSHTPMVKLLGTTPSGLNASSDGEIRVYYDYIMAQNEAYIRPFIEKVSAIMQLSMFGEVDLAIQWEFNPLYQLDAKELAEVQKVKAETSAVLIDSGQVSPLEARQALAADESSAYSSIQVDDVPESVDYSDYEKETDLTA